MFEEKETIIYQERENLEILDKPFVEIKLYDDNGKIIQEIKEGYKSELRIGNIYVRFTKKFNWFQRLMLKWVFGLNIYNI